MGKLNFLRATLIAAVFVGAGAAASAAPVAATPQAIGVSASQTQLVHMTEGMERREARRTERRVHRYERRSERYAHRATRRAIRHGYY
ncbi:MAG: hypothetical protein ACR652_03300 [Methylocystis sp.]|uniref:hypothetical protein n=1 Tax=Methylocystis sp. TaxID=1911079 RepID=UPI003DA5813B